jgi:hypothetical protein
VQGGAGWSGEGRRYGGMGRDGSGVGRGGAPAAGVGRALCIEVVEEIGNKF